MAEYNRTELLLGTKAISKLENSHVMIMGMGAVGSFALEAIVRSGVGQITVIDSDNVQASNINRQLIAYHSTLNLSKVEVAKKRALDINPNCKINAIKVFADINNIEDLCSPAPDIIIDAIDSVITKVNLLEYYYRNNLCVFSSMGAAGKTNPDKIQVADISKTKVCLFARKIRKLLKKKRIYRGFKCVYSTEESLKSPNLNFSVKPELNEEGREKIPLGTICSITGIFGLRLANLAIEKILKIN